MARSHGPFQRACCWCGDAFLARNKSDICCSLGCSEEVYQHVHELQLKQFEFQSLSEKVEVLHEGIYRVHRRIERQVKRLQRLGVQWSAIQGEAAREIVERRERVVSKVLARLNSDCDARDKEVIPEERRLYLLEKDVANLKKIVGEAPFMND